MSTPAKRTTRLADRDDQYVLAVDLGTGGPKIGFVSLTGRVVQCEHHRLDPTFLRRRWGHRRCRGVVDDDHRCRSPRHRRWGRRSHEGRRGVDDRSVGLDDPGRRGGHPGRARAQLDGQPRRRVGSPPAWRAGRRVQAEGLGRVHQTLRRCPIPRRRRPGRSPALLENRPPGHLARRSLDAGTGRLPVDALHGQSPRRRRCR